MHKSVLWKEILLMTAVIFLLAGCRKTSTPAISEILQSTQENENAAAAQDSASASVPEVAAAAEEENTICVFVCGEVVSPGVYYFKEGARKIDAVEAAGGFTESANTAYVNLAELLTDEMQLYVPALGEEAEGDGTGAAATETEAARTGKINLNTATAAQLCELSGIGESKAKAILQYREEHGGFKTVEELTQVSGIGESTLEKIRDYIYVE